MAHKGHPGNEAADRMAKRAVENEEGPGNERRGTSSALDPTIRALFLKGEALTNLKKQLRPELKQWLAEREGLKDKTHLQWTVDNPEKAAHKSATLTQNPPMPIGEWGGRNQNPS